MKTTRLLAFLFVVPFACAQGSAADTPITATGMLFIEFDVGEGNRMEGVNFAKFVPDAKSQRLFPAVTSGKYAAPVRYISFEPAEQVLAAVVGADEAARLSHGTDSVIQIPVEIVLKNYRSEVECDAREYYATLISAKQLGAYTVVTPDALPDGC